MFTPGCRSTSCISSHCDSRSNSEIERPLAFYFREQGIGGLTRLRCNVNLDRGLVWRRLGTNATDVNLARPFCATAGIPRPNGRDQSSKGV